MKRLILFDIDETLIASDGAGRRALHRLLRELHQIPDEAMQVSMSGKTDPQILSEILHLAKKDGVDTVQLLKANLESYLETLAEEIKNADYYIMHEGIIELLDCLIDKSEAFLGLLTGNVEGGARLKLARFNLNRYFPIGAFGSDSANRLDLPAIAKQRAEAHYRRPFQSSETVIIGDSVNDVLCAHHFGARCIAVNTGKTEWQSLERENPAYLFKSLKETEKVLTAIFS